MDWEPRYRHFQECQRHVAWSDYDAQRVRLPATIVDPSLQVLVDDFYTEIERHAHTSRIVSGSQQQVSRLKGLCFAGSAICFRTATIATICGDDTRSAGNTSEWGSTKRTRSSVSVHFPERDMACTGG